MKCGFCGTEVNEGYSVCSHCGAEYRSNYTPSLVIVPFWSIVFFFMASTKRGDMAELCANIGFVLLGISCIFFKFGLKKQWFR